METHPNKERFVSLVSERESRELAALLESDASLRGVVDSPWFDFGKTALIEARSHRPTVEVLLAAGADPGIRSDWKWGSYGVLNENSEGMVRFFLHQGLTLEPHVAAEHGWLDELRQLCKQTPQLAQLRGPDGQFPLHYAATVEVAQFLLQCGADINGRCLDHKSTAAQYLVSSRPEVVRYLIEQGADFDLCTAVVLGDLQLAQNAFDVAPESLTCRAGEGLGDVNRWRLDNFTPAMLAWKKGYADIFEWLCDQMQPSDELLARCWAGQSEHGLSLLKKHRDLNKTVLERASLLPEGAWHGRLDAVRAMLDMGFPINTVGVHNSTAIDRAATRGWSDIVELCLGRGASLRCVNEFGSHPLASTCWGALFWKGEHGDYPAVIAALLKAGCSGGEEPTESDPRGLRRLLPWLVENGASHDVLREFQEANLVPDSARHLFIQPL